MEQLYNMVTTCMYMSLNLGFSYNH